MMSLDFRFASADLKAGELNALVKKIGGAGKVRQVLRGELKLDVIDPSAMSAAKNAKSSTPRTILAGLLEEVGEPIKISAVPRFVARAKLMVNRDGELPISYLGMNLQNNFLDLVEEAVPAATLKQRRLLKRSVDAPILAALGDTDLAKIEKARVVLAHVFNYLKTANRSLWFIFYVADTRGVVWAVGADWGGHGWSLGASSVSYPGEWGVDYRVVSR